jgi:hypothetical protein
LIANNVPAVGAQLPRKSRKRTAATSSPAVNYGNWPQGKIIFVSLFHAFGSTQILNILFFASLGVGKSPANVVGAVEALPHVGVNRGKSQSHDKIEIQLGLKPTLSSPCLVVINNSATTTGSVSKALVFGTVPAFGAQLPHQSRKGTAATSAPAVNDAEVSNANPAGR